MRNILWGAVAVFVATSAGVSAEEAPSEPIVGLALTGSEAVEFLSTAEVVGKPEDFDDLAITSPRRMTLSDGTRTLRAIFKDEHTQYWDTFQYGDGRQVDRVKDSYLHEIAAFELERMLGLDIVAPCVERKLYRRKGSLCLWIEATMTEADRKERGIEPPDKRRWSEQMYTVRLFQQLISDQDYSNIRNLLVDTDFHIYKIDSSMAFYPDPKLIPALNAPVYSRAFLTALREIDRDELEERLGPWLLKGELKTLWQRREKILERADRLVAEHGEAKVLY
jgi:hypothetical protein